MRKAASQNGSPSLFAQALGTDSRLHKKRAQWVPPGKAPAPITSRLSFLVGSSRPSRVPASSRWRRVNRDARHQAVSHSGRPECLREKEGNVARSRSPPLPIAQCREQPFDLAVAIRLAAPMRHVVLRREPRHGGVRARWSPTAPSALRSWRRTPSTVSLPTADTWLQSRSRTRSPHWRMLGSGVPYVRPRTTKLLDPRSAP